MKQKKIFLVALLISSIFSGYFLNPENIGLSGSGSILYNDFRSINPACISNHKGMSINMLGGSFGFGNDFLSISDYNDINGANFDDPTSTKYFPKSDFLGLFNNGFGINGQVYLPIPFSNFVYNNISFSSRTYFWFETVFPESLMDLTLYGNQFNKQYDMTFENSIDLINEHSIGYANTLGSFSYGFRLKYIQGLANSKLKSISPNSSYFSTDSLGFLGKAEYLMSQSIGGSSIALDLGIISDETFNDWNFGISITNLFARVKWDKNNITYNYLKNSIIDQLPLRNNEKQYFSINLDTLNAINMINLPANQIYDFEKFPIVEVYDINNIEFINVIYNEIGDSTYVSNYGKIISTDYGSYLIESTNIPDEVLDTLNADFKEKISQYPVNFHLGAYKEVDENILLTIDLSTGFNNSNQTSENWKLSTGLVFERFEKFPLTMGFSIGGKNKFNSGFSLGYKQGPFQLTYALGTRNGIFIPSWRGLDFSFSAIFKIN